MRLDKFICKSTEYCLAEAAALIENGYILVNGKVAIEVSHQVHKNNVVLFDGKTLIPRCSRYYMLNKPTDTICSNVDEKYPSIFNLLNVDRKTELHITGRLDVDTTGLVLITDDGHWSYNLTSPKTKCPKVYEVVLSRPILPEANHRFQEGIHLQGESKITLPANLQVVNSYKVLLTLTEGRFHQVKRMFAAIGNKVLSLHRLQIGNLELDVDIGHWRKLTQIEIEGLSIRK